jgi:uncharacterized protein involved in exopolysaccharide biosynthesis
MLRMHFPNNNHMNSIVGVFWNALLTAIVVTLLAGLFVAAMPPVYRATAIVKGDTDDMLKIQSGDLLQGVIKTTKADLGQLEGWLEQLMSARTDPVNLLREKLTVSEGDDPEWVNISIEAQSANTASTLANDLAHLYLEQSARVQLSPEEKARLFTAVEESNSRLLSFLQQYPVLLNPGSERARLDVLVGQTEKKQQALMSSLDQFQAQRRAAAEGEIGALTEPGVVRASRRLDTLNLERAELAARYGSQHLKMSGQAARVQTASELLSDEIDAYRMRLTTKIAELGKQLTEVSRVRAKLADELGRFVDRQLALKGLELAKESAVKKYEGMTEETKVELIADAVPPRNTFGVNQLMLLGFVFLVSFMLMVVLMVIRSLRKD